MNLIRESFVVIIAILNDRNSIPVTFIPVENFPRLLLQLITDIKVSFPLV
jgi:hypothetical protein